MKTDPIYMLNPYEKSMTAKVVDFIDDGKEKRIVLDKTVFYPMGGGQSTDQGTLTLDEGTVVEVYQVMIKDGEIWHYLKTDKEIKVGDKVTGEINWERRYKNMQLHSAGHIIDFAMYLLGYSPKTLKPQKADHGKKPYIVYEGEVKKDIKQELEKKAIELIKNKLNFSWEFESLDELKKEALYLQPNLPENKPMRVLRLEGVGAVADGGTIVADTSEVPEIKIEKIEVKDGMTTVCYGIGKQKSAQRSFGKDGMKDIDDDVVNAKHITHNVQQNLHTDLSDSTFTNLTEIKVSADDEIDKANTEEELTILWRSFLGKDGKVTLAFKEIGKVPADQRKDFGQKLNELKNYIDEKINSAKANLKNSKVGEYLKTPQAQLDFDKPKIGHLHPLTQTINDINNIFRSLGYSVMDGPEIETDEYNFIRTNLPADHPARDLQDSIYIEEPNILLRTQTSSIEAHVLEKYDPPFKVVMPGRTYRNEKVNKSNHFTFHQYQLVCVQEKVSMAELLATIEYLFKSYLGDDVVIRFRNKYYPEVEPGVGPDMRCFNCNGKGCPVCKGRGWIEMGGAGIRHPNMLRMAGIDPTKWQGYAFGLGLDRWAMAKHKITDIRTLLGGNLAYKPNVG